MEALRGLLTRAPADCAPYVLNNSLVRKAAIARGQPNMGTSMCAPGTPARTAVSAAAIAYAAYRPDASV